MSVCVHLVDPLTVMVTIVHVVALVALMAMMTMSIGVSIA